MVPKMLVLSGPLIAPFMFLSGGEELLEFIGKNVHVRPSTCQESKSSKAGFTSRKSQILLDQVLMRHIPKLQACGRDYESMLGVEGLSRQKKPKLSELPPAQRASGEAHLLARELVCFPR